MNKNKMILFNNMRGTTIIHGNSDNDDLNGDRNDDDDNDDDTISRRSSSSSSIPGHIKQLPYTLNEKTRLQYASIVVSAAIVFMTLKIRYDKWIEKLNNNMISKDINNYNSNYNDQSIMRGDNINTDNNNIVKLSNGIIYEDTIIIDNI